jgi:prophage regulatory protein
MSEKCLITLPTVKARTGFSATSTIYKAVVDGLLPPQVKRGKRGIAWVEGEIAAVIEARINGSSEDKIRALVRQLVAARCGTAQESAMAKPAPAKSGKPRAVVTARRLAGA